VIKGLLEDLVDRGLDQKRRYLVVMDGSKALRAGVERVLNASSTKIWCCDRAWSRQQRQDRTTSLPSTEEASRPRTIRGGKAMRKEESSCC